MLGCTTCTGVPPVGGLAEFVDAEPRSRRCCCSPSPVPSPAFEAPAPEALAPVGPEPDPDVEAVALSHGSCSFCVLRRTTVPVEPSVVAVVVLRLECVRAIGSAASSCASAVALAESTAPEFGSSFLRPEDMAPRSERASPSLSTSAPVGAAMSNEESH